MDPVRYHLAQSNLVSFGLERAASKRIDLPQALGGEAFGSPPPCRPNRSIYDIRLIRCGLRHRDKRLAAWWRVRGEGWRHLTGNNESKVSVETFWKSRSFFGCFFWCNIASQNSMRSHTLRALWRAKKKLWEISRSFKKSIHIGRFISSFSPWIFTT